MFNHNSDQDHPQGPTGCILHIDLTDALSRLSCPNATFGTLCFSMSLWEGVVPLGPARLEKSPSPLTSWENFLRTYN